MATGTSIRAAALAVLVVGSSTLAQDAAGAGAAAAGDAPTQTITVAAQRFCLAPGRARRRQIGGHRSSARHQGRARRRSQYRQCRRAVVAARLHHRHQGRPDQRVLLRRRRPADGRLRHRGHARSQRHSFGDPPGAAGCGHPGRRHRRGRHSERQRAEPSRGAASLRHRRAAAQFRISRHRRNGQQDRQRHRGPRPRPDHAQGDRRRGRARRHQAARHQPVRQSRLRHGRGQFQQHQSVLGDRPVAQRLQHRARKQLGHRHLAGHGTGRRHSHAGRAEPHRHFR